MTHDLVYYGIAALSCSIIYRQVRSNKQGLAPSPEICSHADGWSQPWVCQLTAATAWVSCIAGVLVAEQESSVARRKGKGCFY